jgi:hypothetical protein
MPHGGGDSFQPCQYRRSDYRLRKRFAAATVFYFQIFGLLAGNFFRRKRLPADFLACDSPAITIDPSAFSFYFSRVKLDEASRNWTALGQADPLWVVLTGPEKKGNRWRRALRPWQARTFRFLNAFLYVRCL